jgi:hypothetical protein
MEEKEVVKVNVPEENITATIDEALSDSHEELPQIPELPREEPPKSEPAAEVIATEKTDKSPEKEPAPQGGEAPIPTGEPKLLAGKFTNLLDLGVSALEEVKVLKIDKKEVSEMIAEAFRTGDTSKVEAKYKELESQVGKQIADEKKNEPPKPGVKTVEPPVATTEPELTAEEYRQAVLDQSYAQFEKTVLAADMREAGIEVPKTDEQLAELKLVNRPMWKEFMDEFQGIVLTNKTKADEFLKAEKEVPVHNNSQREKAKTQILDFGKKFKVEIKPEEIDKILLDAEKEPGLYENRNGLMFIREGSIFRFFKAERAEDLLDRVSKQTEAESLTKGRQQAAEDLKNIDGKAIKSISTTQMPGMKTVPKPIDWNDPEQVRKASIPEKELTDKIDSILN